MTGDDGLYDEMRHLPPGPDRFRSDPLALDEGTAERLLAGSLDPADAPPAYRRVAAVLAAASAEPGPEELAGEARAVRSLAKVARSNPYRAPSRRSPVLSKVLSLKMAAAATLASLLLAGVAVAATGNLPGPAQRVAHRLGAPSAHSSADRAGTSTSTNGNASDATGTRGTGAHGPTGPDATGPAKQGLCQAWQSGEGGENGKKDDSTAFKALAAAAGGADMVADFCKDVMKEAGDHPQGAPPATTPADHSPSDHPGPGSGDNGQPPAAGSSGSGQGAPASTRPDHAN